MQLISSRSLGFALLLSTLILPQGIGAQDTKWKRVTVAETSLSVEIPGKFSSAKKEASSTSGDWVVSTQDYTFDSDDYFVQVTIFEAKAGTNINQAFLKTVASDIGKGMQDDNAKPALVESIPESLDEIEKLKTTYEVKTGADKFVVKGMLIGTSDKVYSVAAVGFPSVKGSLESATRIRDSVKYTK